MTVSGSGGEHGSHRLAGQFCHREFFAGQRLQQILLCRRRRRVDPFVERHAEFGRQLIEQLARVPPGSRRHLGGQESQNHAILVGGPHRAVAPQERGAGAFLAGDPERSVDQPIDEPFEADRGFDQPAAEFLRDAVDDRAGDDGLAHRAVTAPLRTVLEQIGNGGGEIMVRIHQAARAGHDAVPVGIGVVGKGDVEFFAHADQPRHRIGRGAVHPDFSVPIHGHEAEGRIDRIADQRRGKPVALDDGLPIVHAGAAQRIDPYLDACGADRLHVNDISEVGDIGPGVIMAMNARRFARAVIGDAVDAAQTVLEKAVGGALDGGGDIGIRRAAIGRIIFEAAIFRRIMRRRDHDAVGKATVAAPVMGQDGARNHRRRRITVALVDHHLDAIGREHFQRARQGRLRQRVGVDADE